MENLKTPEQIKEHLLLIIDNFKKDECEEHPYDIAQELTKLRDYLISLHFLLLN